MKLILTIWKTSSQLVGVCVLEPHSCFDTRCQQSFHNSPLSEPRMGEVRGGNSTLKPRNSWSEALKPRTSQPRSTLTSRSKWMSNIIVVPLTINHLTSNNSCAQHFSISISSSVSCFSWPVQFWEARKGKYGREGNPLPNKKSYPA